MTKHNPARYTLLTNISYVVRSGLRLHVSAVVIDPYASSTQVRLFGPSPALPICDVAVPNVPYSLSEHPLPEHLPKGTVPAWRTYDLQFVKPDNARKAHTTERISAQFEITTNTMEGQPIEVHTFPDGTSISQVWDALVPAVIRSWGAPYFPTLVPGPVEAAALTAQRR
jgi:hypothetical protein